MEEPQLLLQGNVTLQTVQFVSDKVFVSIREYRILSLSNGFATVILFVLGQV